MVFFVTLHWGEGFESAWGSSSGWAGNSGSGWGVIDRLGQSLWAGREDAFSQSGSGWAGNSSWAGGSTEAGGSAQLGRFVDVVVVVRVGESLWASVSDWAGNSDWSRDWCVFSDLSVVRISWGDGISEFAEAGSTVFIHIDSSQKSEDVLLDDWDVVSSEEVVEGIEINDTISGISDNFVGGSKTEVVSGDEFFLLLFNLSGEGGFLVEDLGKAEFNFVWEDFIISNVVAVSLSADSSDNRVGSWENDFEEIAIRESAISGGGVLGKDVSDVLFEDVEVVFSEEVDDLVNGEVRGGKTSESLEGSVWFEGRSFSEDLSGDFDVLFTVGDGVEEISELVFSGDADHWC